MEFWDLELHISTNNNELVIENYVEKIRDILRQCNSLDLFYVIRPFTITNFCEYLFEKIIDLNVDLKLMKVIISPKKDNYKFIWERQ